MANVFISYSRKDKPFAEKLHHALAEIGRDVWIDWEDIPPTADWWEEIQAGIAGAESFVFVISPDSVRSQICHKEIDYAIITKKRFVPLLVRDITEEQDKAQMPPVVSTHNWIMFNDEQHFQASIDLLVSALDTDLEHVREHTRLLVRAKEWQDRGKLPSFLLDGDEVSAAEEWLARSVDKLPEPTELHTEYVLQSRRNEINRQRRSMSVISAMLVGAIALAIIALLMYRNAQTARKEADKNALAAANAQATSEANIYETRRLQSLSLANFSKEQLKAGSPQNALILAREAVRNREYGVLVDEAMDALLNALDAPWQEASIMTHSGGLSGVMESHDHARLLTWGYNEYVSVWETGASTPQFILPHPSETILGVLWNHNDTEILTYTYTSIYIWEAATGQIKRTLRHQDGFNGVRWNADESRLLTWAYGSAIVWDYSSGEVQMTFYHENTVNGAMWNADESQILTWSADGAVRIWDAETGAERLLLRHASSVRHAIWNPSETYIASFAEDSTLAIWDASTGASIKELKPGGYVTAMTWNPEKNLLLAIIDSKFLLVNVEPQETPITVDVPRLIGGRWNQDGTRFLTWTGTGDLELWDTSAEQPIFSFELEAEFLNARWNSDETELLAWANDGTVLILDAEARELLRVKHIGVVNVLWDEEKDQLVSWSGDGTLIVWKATSPDRSEYTFEHPGLGGFEYNAARNYLFTWGQGGVYVLDGQTGAFIDSLVEEDTLFNAQISPSRRYLLVWSADTPIQLWDTETLSQLHQTENNIAMIEAVWSPQEQSAVLFGEGIPGNNSYLWTPGTAMSKLTDGWVQSVLWMQDETQIMGITDLGVQKWDVASGSTLETISLGEEINLGGSLLNHSGTAILGFDSEERMGVWKLPELESLFKLEVADDTYISYGMWNVDDRFILAYGWNSVQWIDASTGEVLYKHSLEGVQRVDWDEDATVPALIWRDYELCLWKIASNTLLPCIPFQLGTADALALPTADWQYIYTLEGDNLLQAWEVATGKKLLLRFPHPKYLWTIDFNQTGTHLVTQDEDHIRFWNTSLDYYIALADTRMIRHISAEERAQFFMPPLLSTPTVEAVALAPTATLTPLPTLTPVAEYPQMTLLPPLTPSPTVEPAEMGFAILGRQTGRIDIGGRALWSYNGHEGEILTIQVNALSAAGDVIFSNTGLDAFMYVYDPAGTLLFLDDQSGGGNNARITDQVLPSAGTYTIEIRSYLESSGGAYELIIDQTLPGIVPATPSKMGGE